MNIFSINKSWVIKTLLYVLFFTNYLVGQTPTIDLTSYNPSSIPSGVTLEWHNGLPISTGNLMTVSQSQKVGLGLYYAVFNYNGECYTKPTPLKVVSNDCLISSIDLKSSVDSSLKPTNYYVSIHTSSVPSDANRVINTIVVPSTTPTTYYIAYRDANGCYSSVNALIVTIANELTSPTTTVTNTSNSCPSLVVNLNSLVSNSLSGATLVWYTNASHSGSAVNTPTAVGTGTYFAYYYDTVSGCYSPASASVNVTISTCDLDGDGDPDNTDPDAVNGCVWGPNQILANTTLAWRNTDCDGDGVTNYKEVTGTDNNPSTTADNTNPLDGCSYNAVDQVLGSTSPEWKLLDCDKDGNPNGTDSNPQTPTAVNDAYSARYGSATGYNILANDDFLPSVAVSLTKTGGTANGSVSFNPLTGILTYTPLLSERGTTVTVIYQVCNTTVTPNVCASATVTITVPVDTDADGVPDADDLDDDNDGILDTVENAQLSADTDGDGILNRLDLDSDNDGINDVDEANGIDDNGDGMADGLVSPTGIPSTAGLGLTPPDTDNDSKPNPYDLDSNNDGVSDLAEGVVNPNLDANGDGIVDCITNCDPDGDGILTPVDGLPNVWKDALLPDLTPTTEINSLEFLAAGASKDFLVNVFEINNVPNVSGSTIGFRVAKTSAFTITYSSTSGTSNVFGGTANSNSDWIFTENTNFITVTAKPGITIPQNGKKIIGFTATRKAGVPSNTSQNITVTIIYGSAGEEKVNNNTVETKITAN